MRHRPHLHLPGPWQDRGIPVPPASVAHLRRVLRVPAGTEVTYTDGAGIVGRGEWNGSTVERGDEEHAAARARSVTVVVAVPRSKERQRFMVEKLQELDVARLVWLDAERSQVPPPRDERIRMWAVGALEQSRGARLMEIGQARPSQVDGAIALDADAATPLRWPDGSHSVTVVIGPEGGLTEDERSRWPAARLGPTILRTETAAIVAAGHLLLS